MAAAVADHRAGVHLHRVVVRDAGVVLGIDLDRRGVEGRIGVAFRLRCWRIAGLQRGRLVAVLQVGQQVRFVRRGLVLNLDQHRGVARQFEGLRHHQRDRLAAVVNLVVVQRPERRAGRGRHVLVEQPQRADLGTVLVRDHVNDPGHRQRLACIDRHDAAARNGAVDHHAVGEIRRGMLGRVAGVAGHLGNAVDAGRRRADPRLPGAGQRHRLLILVDRFEHGLGHASVSSR